MTDQPPVAYQPDEIAGDVMHLSLASVRKAHEDARPLQWRRILAAICAWAAKAFHPVEAEACPACAVKARQVRFWQEKAGEWATECLAHEKAEESLTAQLNASRQLRREEVRGTPRSGRLFVPVLGGPEEDAVSYVEVPMRQVRFPKTAEDVRRLHSDCKTIAEDPKWRMSQDDYVKAALGAGVRVSCIDAWGNPVIARARGER